jgi:lipopolysaccharide/colanic/teichoic acid biosynthesis glycosyltransferase
MDAAFSIDNIKSSQASLTTQSTNSTPVFTKNILKVGSNGHVPEHDYIQETIYFSNVSLDESVSTIKSDVPYDCILVSATKVSSNLITLRDSAKLKAIPFILYSAKFEESVKALAIKIGADEYHHGAITYAFLKRIEFIKKLKNYKNERGNKPYVQKTYDEVPKIKLWTMKRAFDIAVSLTGLIFLLPLLIIIAISIKLESKGPIFYISKRAGKGYKIFNFYKFRSMRVGADAELKKMQHLNQYGESTDNGVFFKFKNDPRVTRIGSILRNTSLDELPQLINVLIGDMSLVGNRPLPLYEAEKLTKDHIAWRFLAPAGITGLWQVTKRGKEEMSPEERIALDMEYAMKNSFWLDMKILLSTIPALLQKEQV